MQIGSPIFSLLPPVLSFILKEIDAAIDVVAEKVREVVGLEEDVTGRRILIVDDIIDTGNTTEFLVNLFMDKKVKDVKIAALTYKPESYRKSIPLDFIGLNMKW